MSNLVNKFLEAMDIVVDQKLANSNKDTTIVVEIVSKDPDGTYTVSKINSKNSSLADQYTGVFANALYEQGNKVLMLISQDGQEKTILSKVGQNESDKARAFMAIEDQYNFIGGNLVIATDGLEAQALWIRGANNNKISLMRNNRTDQVEYILDDYISLYRKLKVSAKFTVQATLGNDMDANESNDINYGIRFTFASNKVYEMDIDDIAGNPYSLNGQIQTKLFEFEKDVGQIQKIELFKTAGVSSFSISDFTIYGAIDPTKEGKNVWIQTPEGTTLSADKLSLSFEAIVRHNGEIVTDISNLTFEWSVEDEGATNGWRQLSSITGNNKLILENDDIWLRNSTIVCKVIDGLEDYSHEVEVANLKRPEKWFEIIKEDNADKTLYILSITKANTNYDLPSDLEYEWSLKDPGGRPLSLGIDDEGKVIYNPTTATIEINPSQIETGYVICNCEVKNKDGVWLGTDNETIVAKTVNIDTITTYYTAQKADVQKDGVPGRNDTTGKFEPMSMVDPDPDSIPEEKTISDYWWSDAEDAGFSENLPRLWTFEKISFTTGKDPIITEPAMIATWSPNIYRMDLTNDGGTIVTGADGDASNPGYWDDANTSTTVKLFKGDKEFTVAEAKNEGWSLDVTSSTLVFSKDDDTWTIDVEGFSDNNVSTSDDNKTVDSGFLTITLNKMENGTSVITLEKQFSIKKIKNGGKGDAATSYWITAEPSTVYKGADGNYLKNFTTLKFEGMLQTGIEAPRLFIDGDNLRLSYCFNNDKEWTTNTSDNDNIQYNDNGNTLTFNLKALMDDKTNSIKPDAISCRMELGTLYEEDGEEQTRWTEINTQTVLVSAKNKSIKDSYKIYTLHDSESISPILPARLDTGVFNSNYMGVENVGSEEEPNMVTYITAETDSNQRWYKNDLPPITDDDPYQWACDYTEFTDDTAYLSQPERITPKDAAVTKELKTIYCGQPTISTGSSTPSSDSSPLPAGYDLTNEILSRQPWPGPSKPNFNNDDFKSSGSLTTSSSNVPPIEYSVDIENSEGEIITYKGTVKCDFTWTWSLNQQEQSKDSNGVITNPYIYKSEQMVFNNNISADGWSEPKIHAIWNEYNLTPAQAELMLLGGGKKGLFTSGDGDVYINADLIKTGALVVQDGTEKPIFSANVDTKKVTLSGWQATNSLLGIADKDSQGNPTDLSKLTHPSEVWDRNHTILYSGKDMTVEVEKENIPAVMTAGNNKNSKNRAKTFQRFNIDNYIFDDSTTASVKQPVKYLSEIESFLYKSYSETYEGKQQFTFDKNFLLPVSNIDFIENKARPNYNICCLTAENSRLSTDNGVLINNHGVTYYYKQWACNFLNANTLKFIKDNEASFSMLVMYSVDDGYEIKYIAEIMEFKRYPNETNHTGTYRPWKSTKSWADDDQPHPQIELHYFAGTNTLTVYNVYISQELYQISGNIRSGFTQLEVPKYQDITMNIPISYQIKSKPSQFFSSANHVTEVDIDTTSLIFDPATMLTITVKWDIKYGTGIYGEDGIIPFSLTFSSSDSKQSIDFSELTWTFSSQYAQGINEFNMFKYTCSIPTFSSGITNLFNQTTIEATNKQIQTALSSITGTRQFKLQYSPLQAFDFDEVIGQISYQIEKPLTKDAILILTPNIQKEDGVIIKKYCAQISIGGIISQPQAAFMLLTNGKLFASDTVLGNIAGVDLTYSLYDGDKNYYEIPYTNEYYIKLFEFNAAKFSLVYVLHISYESGKAEILGNKLISSAGWEALFSPNNGQT